MSNKNYSELKDKLSENKKDVSVDDDIMTLITRVEAPRTGSIPGFNNSEISNESKQVIFNFNFHQI